MTLEDSYSERLRTTPNDFGRLSGSTFAGIAYGLTIARVGSES